MHSDLKAVGLSISRCILSLAAGEIPIDAVESIKGGTAFETPQDLWDAYSSTFWKGHLLRARKVFFELADAGRIEQPRLQGLPPPNAAAGIWQIGEFHLDTREARDILSISSFFLGLESGQRGDLLNRLTGKDLEAFLASDLPEETRHIFPNFSSLAKVIPAEDLYQTVVNRLRRLYQEASDDEMAKLHPYVMKFLAPFLKDRMHKRNTTKRMAIKLPGQYSQIG